MRYCLFIVLATSFFFSDCKNKVVSDKPITNLPIKLKKEIPLTYDTTLWADIGQLDTTILLDMKYATEDNFVKEKMYECGRCFVRPAVAKVILEAQQQLQKENLGLKMFDCYRPKPVQERLWKKVPDANYVAPPWEGSMHNRGVAIDLTIVDAKGNELDMGTPYDFFGEEAHHTYTKHPNEVKANRKKLKSLMESLSLEPIRTEWWHYSYRKEEYPISEMVWDCDNATVE